MSGLYDDALLALSRAPLPPPLAEATHRAMVDNPLCGDRVGLSMRIDAGRVVDLGFDVEACAICAAAAAWLHQRLAGAELERWGDEQALLEAAMAGHGDGPAAVFAALAAHPSRRGCALLPFRALERALHPAAASGVEVRRPTLEGPDAFAVAREVLARGEGCAIATLVSVVGSSPCPIGSRMVIAETGDFWGSVSGGCVESAVVQAGLRVLEGAPPALLTHQISNSAAGEVGLPCGGQVRVHVALAELPVGDGPLRLLELETGALRTLGEGELPASVRSLGAAALETGRGALSEDGAFFVEPVQQRPRLVLVGGTHVAQKLAALARTVGLDPVLVDPRSALASASRFPTVDRRLERPADALPDLLDERTAVVMLTHDAKLDDPALRIALGSDAFYVGALGSRKTQRARLERLRAEGVLEEQLARLRGPAGLPIGAIGAGEIALSILAEIVATLRAPKRAPRVGALVLAAGRSTRAGDQNKLLLEVEGEPMIRRVVRQVLAAPVARCVVVLGHEADRVREALRGLEVELVMNERFAEGMGTSIARGVETLADTDAVLVALGDMPFVGEATVRRILEAHRPSTAHLVIAPEAATAEGARRGHPVLWPRRYFEALMGLTGDGGGRSILRDAPGALMRVPTAGDGVLRDVDRPGDL